LSDAPAIRIARDGQHPASSGPHGRVVRSLSRRARLSYGP
jgi:hypothetical protein